MQQRLIDKFSLIKFCLPRWAKDRKTKTLKTQKRFDVQSDYQTCEKVINFAWLSSEDSQQMKYPSKHIIAKVNLSTKDELANKPHHRIDLVFERLFA